MLIVILFALAVFGYAISCMYTHGLTSGMAAEFLEADWEGACEEVDQFEYFA